MQLSLSKLPWQWQIGAFVLVCAGAVGGFWHFYVTEFEAELKTRESRLASLKKDIAKGVATARRLPEFQSQVDQLEDRLESLAAVLPEQKDVGDILRRVQGLAAQSNLALRGFTPQPTIQQTLYAEVPIRVQAEGTYHNLGAFFDRVSKFPRIINVGSINIKTKNEPGSANTIVAEYTATTFVLQEGVVTKKGAKTVPKQPAAKPKGK